MAFPPLLSPFSIKRLEKMNYRCNAIRHIQPESRWLYLCYFWRVVQKLNKSQFAWLSKLPIFFLAITLLIQFFFHLSRSLFVELKETYTFKHERSRFYGTSSLPWKDVYTNCFCSFPYCYGKVFFIIVDLLISDTSRLTHPTCFYRPLSVRKLRITSVPLLLSMLTRRTTFSVLWFPTR